MKGSRHTWVRAQRRGRRALFLSSPIGLGHARRDVAIAQELRTLVPGLQIDWLAQHPVTRVLADAGETIHPASAWLANESAHIEDESADHDLHAFQAIRRMDEILVNNFMVFNDVVDETYYDLVIGDEAWDVDYFLHENPELKRFAFAWLTDFVGWLPMPAGGTQRSRWPPTTTPRCWSSGPATDGSGTPRSSSAIPTTSWTPRSAPGCRISASGPAPTTTSPAMSPGLCRRRRSSARRCGRGLATVRRTCSVW